MSTAEERRYTVEEYLEIERSSEIKHQYYLGEIFAMTGSSPEHNLIEGNLVAALKTRLRGKCKVFVADIRVKVNATGLYTYPDIAVACGEVEWERIQGLSTLVNPTLIVEVLSESTEKYDRGQKFLHYQTIPSLKEYVLVSQNDYLLETFRRREDEWSYATANGLDAKINFQSIDFEMSLADIYDEVEITEGPRLRPTD